MVTTLVRRRRLAADMTRVAGANPRIWVDILLENSQPMSEALAEHRRRIEQLERALAAGDAGFLARWVGDAARNRRKMLEQAYPDPGSLQRIRVHVPDRPGVLAGITQALSAERINLEDFELKHLSPERGGTLTSLRASARPAAPRSFWRRRVRCARLSGARRAVRVEPVPALVGHVAVPGDKSISHRALLIGAICEGETRIGGFGRSADTESTIAAVRALGVRVDEHDVDTLTVHGVGLRGLAAPDAPIDCGNAATLMRLLVGVLAGQAGRFELAGDDSLSRRPMERVAEPLRRMGRRSRPRTATRRSLSRAVCCRRSTTSCPSPRRR